MVPRDEMTAFVAGCRRLPNLNELVSPTVPRRPSQPTNSQQNNLPTNTQSNIQPSIEPFNQPIACTPPSVPLSPSIEPHLYSGKSSIQGKDKNLTTHFIQNVRRSRRQMGLQPIGETITSLLPPHPQPIQQPHNLLPPSPTLSHPQSATSPIYSYIVSARSQI